MAVLKGCGGCPDSSEILLPDLPFDFLQPQMVGGVTQIGYGGPFIVRSNPVSGLIDAIRNLCFPVPSQQNDNSYQDLSGLGLGSYGDATSAYPGDVLGGFYPQGGYNTPAPTCNDPMNPCWDYTHMMCVPCGSSTTTPPPATAGTMTCPMTAYDICTVKDFGDRRKKAYDNNDCSGLDNLADEAHMYAEQSTGITSANWLNTYNTICKDDLPHCQKAAAAAAAKTSPPATTNPPPSGKTGTGMGMGAGTGTTGGGGKSTTTTGTVDPNAPFSYTGLVDKLRGMGK